MAISSASNIASLRAQSNLRIATTELSSVYERLSSGLRINNASDDPAGLALLSKLEADTRVAGVAIRNANDGISVTNITNSALDEVSNMLARMLELANQSANGTYTTAQRSAISLEFVALGSEVERIAKTTTFNGLNLLSNSSTITLQVGIDSTSNSQISISPALATLTSLGLAATNGSSLVYSVITTSDAGSQFASLNALSAVQNAINSLSVVRGTIGASESRLTSALRYIEVARENFAAAASRIRDIDVAEEVAKMTSLQVLQQSATAVLAQANQTPKLVLELLK